MYIAVTWVLLKNSGPPASSIIRVLGFGFLRLQIMTSAIKQQIMTSAIKQQIMTSAIKQQNKQIMLRSWSTVNSILLESRTSKLLSHTKHFHNQNIK